MNTTTKRNKDNLIMPTTFESIKIPMIKGNANPKEFGLTMCVVKESINIVEKS